MKNDDDDIGYKIFDMALVALAVIVFFLLFTAEM